MHSAFLPPCISRGADVAADNGAQEPPKHLKFEKNVVVRIAGFSAGAVSLHHPKNAHQLALVKGWVKVAKTVYIWVRLSFPPPFQQWIALTRVLSTAEWREQWGNHAAR